MSVHTTHPTLGWWSSNGTLPTTEADTMREVIFNSIVLFMSLRKTANMPLLLTVTRYWAMGRFLQRRFLLSAMRRSVLLQISVILLSVRIMDCGIPILQAQWHMGLLLPK